MARPKGSKNKPKEVTAPETPVAQEGKVGDEPKSSAPPHYRDRLALLNEISASNKERKAAEESAEGEAEPVEDAPEQEPEAQQEEGEEPEAIEAAPEKVEPAKHKFTIDGKEVELTDDEVREHVQKSATADTRLREAAKLREDARRQSPTLDQSRIARPLPDASSAPDAGQNGPDKETVQKLTKALMYGNEEEVAGAVEVVLGGGRQASQVTRDLPTQTQGMTPDQIAAFVDEKLSFENAKRILEMPKDQGGFADVYGDPMLMELFQQRDAKLLQEGDKRPYAERYKAIGEELRKWKDELVQKNAPPTGLENRDQLKRTTGVVRGAGGKLPTAPLTTKPKTQEEKIADMRRSRGLN